MSLTGRSSAATPDLDRNPDAMPVLVVDSVTVLGDTARDKVVICGSHAGDYVGTLAARAGVRGIVLSDAGVGLDRAGVSGLQILQRAGIPAAAVAADSSTIGDAADIAGRGRLSTLNDLAAAAGCEVGMGASEAAELMKTIARTDVSAGELPEPVEARHLIEAGPPAVWTIDSASLANSSDDGAILITGSHGSLLGGRPETALKADALAAVFNDAGGQATTRLEPLAERGIAAAVVRASSARIGEASSTYEDGVLGALNEPASRAGATAGMATTEFVDLFLQKGIQE